MRYRSCKPDDTDLHSRPRELAGLRRRFGYRRLHILLRRDGLAVSRKETQPLYHEEGLTVRRTRGRSPSAVRPSPSRSDNSADLTSNAMLSSPHRAVRVDCWCIVVSAAIAGRRWSGAEPEAGDGGVAASGAGGR